MEVADTLITRFSPQKIRKAFREFASIWPDAHPVAIVVRVVPFVHPSIWTHSSRQTLKLESHSCGANAMLSKLLLGSRFHML
jgi:hypothetical protein